MARVFGLEVLHMADVDVLPYDYVTYARQIQAYLATAQGAGQRCRAQISTSTPPWQPPIGLPAEAAMVMGKQLAGGGNPAVLNASLRAVEGDLLAPEGLPGRPWFRHTIFAPGEYTGYAAVVIPGVNEAIDAHDAARAQAQMANVTAALVRATATLEDVP